MSELSLWLDSYDDIFSDFDSRHYLKRRVSEDFIEELKTTLKYKTEHAETLLLLLPSHLRKTEIENGIAASLHEQFHSRFETLYKKEKKIYRRGFILLIAGILVMAIDSYLAYKGLKMFFITVLRIIMEPAAWFMMWNGLDQLIYNYRKAKAETALYRVISEFKIHFKDS
jgi:hypothetical protein